MKKSISFLLIAALMTLVLSGCGSSASKTGSGAAETAAKSEDAIKINDTTLKSDYIDARVNQIFQQNQLDINDSMADYYKSQVITGLVDTELIMQEAASRGIEASDDDVKDYKEELINNRYGSEDNFKEYVDQYGISDEVLDRMLKENVIYNKLADELSKDVTVDAQSYYNEHADEFNVADQVKASHILVDDEDTAKDIIKQLDDGADFAELAKEYSTDPGTKDNGGDLGYFTADTMVQEFSDAAFALEPGTYTETPVKTSYGYHVIKVEDKKAAHQQTFDEVKDELTKYLTNQEVQNKVSDIVKTLRESAKIEYLLDDYNPDKLIEKAQEAAQAAQEEQEKESSSTTETSGSSSQENAAAQALLNGEESSDTQENSNSSTK